MNGTTNGVNGHTNGLTNGHSAHTNSVINSMNDTMREPLDLTVLGMNSGTSMVCYILA